jgi:alkanesulfonate monooxygenase SsuD/methylene tetrahydromethanopterin reductase-like flavin-dependent oxidoreductase (luciferase family)
MSCPRVPAGTIRAALPSKGPWKQIKGSFSSYVKGVAWGVSALASRTGVLGDVAKEEAIETNGRLGEAWGQIKTHPGQTALAVGAAGSKYPLQFASRMGTGYAVSFGFTPYAGVPMTGVAMYGSAFEAAYEHPDVIAATAFVGELCAGGVAP